MKLSEYKKAYYIRSGKTSDISRQLAFAGIALVWIFRMENSTFPKIPYELLLSLYYLVCSLMLDLFQYVFGTLIWGGFHRFHEAKKNNILNDPEISASAWLNAPINICFGVKLGSLIYAYIFIAKFLWEKWISG
ncbi:MAG: hypothetical protein KAI43_07815 [Candidatus Aureabacteria bacterium]|nr:hypothetical protein [Candidatus Auribacterota bacterium]